MHRFLWRALCSGCCALLPLSAAAQDATVRPKVRLAAPQPRPALTSPISVPARIDVTVPVPPQTMIVGHSATLDVQVKSVAVSQPIVLSAQAGGERPFQFIPPQIVGSGVAKLTVGPALGDAPGQQTRKLAYAVREVAQRNDALVIRRAQSGALLLELDLTGRKLRALRQRLLKAGMSQDAVDEMTSALMNGGAR